MKNQKISWIFKFFNFFSFFQLSKSWFFCLQIVPKMFLIPPKLVWASPLTSGDVFTYLKRPHRTYKASYKTQSVLHEKSWKSKIFTIFRVLMIQFYNNNVIFLPRNHIQNIFNTPQSTLSFLVKIRRYVYIPRKSLYDLWSALQLHIHPQRKKVFWRHIEQLYVERSKLVT